jgi:hypothetical protein
VQSINQSAIRISAIRNNLPFPLHLSQRSPLAFVGRTRRRHRRAIQPFKPSGFDLLGSRWRSQIVEQSPGLRSGNVPFRQCDNFDVLCAAEGTADFNRVAGMNAAVRTRGLPVDRDSARPARLLRLRSRPEQARDVEPDVEANAGSIQTLGIIVI